MSERGITFLENWINTNITDNDRKRGRDRAKELAAFCLVDAALLGITIDDMEPEWGSLGDIIYDAMQDVLGDELVSWKAFAASRRGTLH